MKTIPHLLLCAIASLALAMTSVGESPQVDPIEAGMRQAFADYKTGNTEAVTARLRELLKLLEEKGSAKVATVLPDSVGDWQGESLKKDDLAVVGGGISISRTYVSGDKKVTVKVIKDSPLVNQLIPILTNEELIQLSNRKTSRISGETAIMDGEHKMQMVIDGRILLELEGNAETSEKDYVGIARKLDLAALAKMK